MSSITCIYKPHDLRYIFFRSDEKGIMTQLESHLNKIPSYQFMPSFRGVPKPVVFLNKFKSKSGEVIYYCYSGLWGEVSRWCKEKGVEMKGIDDNFIYNPLFTLTIEEFTTYVNDWNLNISPRDYQIKAAYNILRYRQSLSQLATRAGKTLIAYIVFRYMLERGSAHNILMIVPSVQLVKQGVTDMSEYQEFFKSETIWAKSERCSSSNLTIGTYQSLVKLADKKSCSYDPSFFNKFDVVVVDECHHLIAKSINTILGLDFMKNLKLRFGFTGTLPKEGTIESFCCQSLMGPQIQNLTSKELIDDGFLAKPIITQIQINYDLNDSLIEDYIRCGEYLNSNYKMQGGKKILLPVDKREFTMIYNKTLPYALQKAKEMYDPREYMDYLVDLCKSNGSNLLVLEQMLTHKSKKRLDVIEDVLRGVGEKNVIVFAHHTEYLNYLKKYFEQKFPDKLVYIIKGSTSIKKRQEVLDEMLTNNNVILFASYGCCSTGLTFKNVDYGVFAQSFKSEIVNMQSLGRLLLRTKDKSECYLYDIVDVFPTKKIYSQGLSKIKLYQKEGHIFKIKKV